MCSVCICGKGGIFSVWVRAVCGYVCCGGMDVCGICGVEVFGMWETERCSIKVFTAFVLIALQMKYTCSHTQSTVSSGNKGW